MSSYDNLPRRRRRSSSYAGSGYAPSNMSGSTARGDPRDDRGDPQNSDADYMTPEQQARYADLERRGNANFDREHRRAMERGVGDSTRGSEGGRSRRSQRSQERFLGDDDLHPRQPREGLPIGPPTGSLHRRSTRGAVMPYDPLQQRSGVSDCDYLMGQAPTAGRRRFDDRATSPVTDRGGSNPTAIARRSTVRTYPDGSREETITDFYSGSQRPRRRETDRG